MSSAQNKYANVKAGETITGNGILHNGSAFAGQSNYINKTNPKKIQNDSEINC